jgi:hypothetical protein
LFFLFFVVAYRRHSESENTEFLVLSKSRSTVVLRTDAGLEELPANTGFDLSRPTLYAGRLAGHAVQVHSGGISVIRPATTRTTASLPVNPDVPIVACTACDPYLVLVRIITAEKFFGSSRSFAAVGRRDGAARDAVDPGSVHCAGGG